MATLKKGLIIGVIMMLVAFVLCVISIGAPFWYKVEIDGVHDPHRKLPKDISAGLDNTIKARYGLWQLCSNTFKWDDAKEPIPTVTAKPNSYYLDLHGQEKCLNLVVHSWDFFRGTQASMLISVMLMITSMVFAILYCLSGRFDAFIMLFSVTGVTSAIFVMIAGVLFGLSAPGHVLENYNYPMEVYIELELVRLRHFITGYFDWGFSLGMASGVVALIGSVLATVQWEARLFKKVYTEEDVPMHPRSGSKSTHV